jgi:hypothetical protein
MTIGPVLGLLIPPMLTLCGLGLNLWTTLLAFELLKLEEPDPRMLIELPDSELPDPEEIYAVLGTPSMETVKQ